MLLWWNSDHSTSIQAEKSKACVHTFSRYNIKKGKYNKFFAAVRSCSVKSYKFYDLKSKWLSLYASLLMPYNMIRYTSHVDIRKCINNNPMCIWESVLESWSTQCKHSSQFKSCLYPTFWVICVDYFVYITITYYFIPGFTVGTQGANIVERWIPMTAAFTYSR